MAIVKMKKLRVITMARDRKNVLAGLQRIGCVQIKEPDTGPGTELLQRFSTVSSGATEAKKKSGELKISLDALKEHAGMKEGMFILRKDISMDDFLSSKNQYEAEKSSRDINDCMAEISSLTAEVNRLHAKKASLLPWSECFAPLDYEGTPHTKAFLLVGPVTADLAEIQHEVDRIGGVLEEISSDKTEHYCWAVCLKEDYEAVLDAVRSHSFSVCSFAGLVGTVSENIEQLDSELGRCRRRVNELESKIYAKRDSEVQLKLLSDRCRAEESLCESEELVRTDEKISYFEAWTPASSADKVAAALESMGCAYEFSDPAEEEYNEVPILLKNNLFTKPLNMVTEMYSLPSYDNVDPNPLMAPFFVLFFGIMMADMAYGLLMIAAGVYITKKYHPKGGGGHMFSLATLCGISTFIFGALTGGFFGDFLTQFVLLVSGKDFALPALFTPLDDTIMILIGSIALGFVHVVTGMAVSVSIKFRRHQYMDAFWNEITWWIVFIGGGLMALKVTPYVLYAGVALVFAGPIINGKGIGKITGIFSSLYNNVTGFFGDFLSYSRLMALMLSGSVIAQVFNTLGAMPGNVIVFVIISLIGNMLNFALNLLGCYVHDLRLQCLEYFNKFYEDGGKPFRPLNFDTKYVDIKQ